MPTVFEEQTGRLVKAITDHAGAHGAKACEEIQNAAGSLLAWLHHLRVSEPVKWCEPVLNGVQAAIIEVAGCLAIGFVRPALFSLRAQVDLLLSWLYFKDHLVEWRHVQNTGEGFRLKTDLLRYLEEYVPNFKSRFGFLKQVKRRREEDPYRLLSAHVHSQSVVATPTIGDLERLVAPLPRCAECAQLQVEVAEYLSDILLACYADKWASLPKQIIDDANARLSKDQQKTFWK